MGTIKPPIRCTPCRINFSGKRYRILSDGSVAELPNPLPSPVELGLPSVEDVLQWELDNLIWNNPRSDLARKVRREAARLRRNRNSRERAQAMRDIGMKRTCGWK